MFRGVTCNVIKAKPFPTEVVTKAKLPPRSRGWGCCQRMLHQSVQTRGFWAECVNRCCYFKFRFTRGSSPHGLGEHDQ